MLVKFFNAFNTNKAKHDRKLKQVFIIFSSFYDADTEFLLQIQQLTQHVMDMDICAHAFYTTCMTYIHACMDMHT